MAERYNRLLESSPKQQRRTFGTQDRNGWNLPGLSYGLPTAFDSGTYKFLGWTYGYIQDKDYVVTANKGQIADMKINLIIGVNVTLDILFKKEGIISPTQYNMSARVRVFDDYGNLVGTWMSSQGVYTSAITGQTLATAASDTATFPWDGGYNYLPAGINQLHVDLAGLPYAPTVANLGGASSVTTWSQYYRPPGYTPEYICELSLVQPRRADASLHT